MGQKSNIITLRKSNLDLNSYTSKDSIQLLAFIKSFEYLLKKRGVLVADRNLNFIGNICYLNFSLFFSSSKLSFFRRKGLIKKASLSSVRKNKNLSFAKIFDIFKKLRQNVFVISVINLNRLVNNKKITFLYKKTKKFVNIIFSRRFNLYIDFLKITTLFLDNNVNTSFYLLLLGQIFKALSKKIHNKFLFFLKFLFKTLIFDTLGSSNIKGVKFVICGKLSGKPRASSACINEGSIPNQTFSKNIAFSKCHSYTLLGAFGLKIWVYKN